LVLADFMVLIIRHVMVDYNARLGQMVAAKLVGPEELHLFLDQLVRYHQLEEEEDKGRPVMDVTLVDLVDILVGLLVQQTVLMQEIKPVLQLVRVVVMVLDTVLEDIVELTMAYALRMALPVRY
jgi:hypothetical protein